MGSENILVAIISDKNPSAKTSWWKLDEKKSVYTIPKYLLTSYWLQRGKQQFHSEETEQAPPSPRYDVILVNANTTSTLVFLSQVSKLHRIMVKCLRNIIQNKWTVHFKNVQVIKSKVNNGLLWWRTYDMCAAAGCLLSPKALKSLPSITGLGTSLD